MLVVNKGSEGPYLVDFLKIQKCPKNNTIHPQSLISHLGIIKNHKTKKNLRKQKNKKTPNCLPLESRSGAGVGIGILRGAGDSLTSTFLDFDDLSRFNHRKMSFVWKALREADCFGPTKNQTYSKIFHSVQTCF